MAQRIDIERVLRQLEEIRSRALDFERSETDALAQVHPQFRDSAKNLLHYLALRGVDLRDLQQELAELGLSSLGRSERNVLASIKAVEAVLQQGLDTVPSRPLVLRSPVADRHKAAIFGECGPDREVSIMVTMPAEAAVNKALAVQMLEAGMNIARINAARDDEATWTAIVDNVRKASEESGKPCRIVMDLPGPKIRTGSLAKGPKVIRFKPRRDPLGRVIAPRRIRLVRDNDVWTGTKFAVVPVPADCVDYAEIGDVVTFRDTRGRKRRMSVVEKDEKGIVVELFKGAYIATGAKFVLRRSKVGEKLRYRFGDLPAIELPLLLKPGDTLLLHRDDVPGAPAVEGDDGQIMTPAHISCGQPEVFDYVSAGERVSLNDGKISGVIAARTSDVLEIDIRKAKPTGSRLRADRGINFPDSDIRLPGLTSSDKSILEFVVRQADAVSLSFVRRPQDVMDLHGELERLGAEDIGVIVKIETKGAFQNLPEILLAAMRRYPTAVMIARGDLAVEAGWERLAELQEEVLWICEAAQVPVIWATQVLERTAKRGLPSRAEISDAALSQRADCVMLNKGPHIIAAIRMLDDILRRMQAHQYKKTATLRKLHFGKERAAV